MTPEEKYRYCRKKHYSASYAEYWMAHAGCEALCGREASAPHHCRSRGASGDDAPENLLALCFYCHERIHHEGEKKFMSAYPHLKTKILTAHKRPRSN